MVCVLVVGGILEEKRRGGDAQSDYHILEWSRHKDRRFDSKNALLTPRNSIRGRAKGKRRREERKRGPATSHHRSPLSSLSVSLACVCVCDSTGSSLVYMRFSFLFLYGYYTAFHPQGRRSPQPPPPSSVVAEH